MGKKGSDKIKLYNSYYHIFQATLFPMNGDAHFATSGVLLLEKKKDVTIILKNIIQDMPLQKFSIYFRKYYLSLA